MPSSRSIYRKVQLVLQYAKAADCTSISDLENSIRAENPLAFHTRRFDRKKDFFVTIISEKSIHSAVKFCRELKLIKENGSLTAEGRQATRQSKFEEVVSNQILSHFRNVEINIDNLNANIIANLQLKTPVLPTCKELWSLITAKIDYAKFSTMLNLLAQCGFAESSQRKVYLHINTNTNNRPST
jgi:hypothetical protein